MNKSILFAAAVAMLVSCHGDDEKSTGHTELSENFNVVRIEGRPNLTDISFIDKDHGIVSGDIGYFIKTDDGGVSWTYVEDSPFVSFSSAFMFDANTIFAGRVGIYKFDASRNLNELGNLSNYSGAIKGIYFKSAQQGFILKDSDILKTIDGGNNWTLNFGAAQSLKMLTFPSQNIGYAAGGTTHDGASGAVLYKTADGGETWTNIALSSAETGNY